MPTSGGVRSEPSLPPLDTVLAQVGGWSAALDGSGVQARRDVLALIVDTVTPERMIRGRYQARITWTLLGEALRRATTNEATAT